MANPDKVVLVAELATAYQKIALIDEQSTRALCFLMLTAARSGEVRSMAWSEIDLDSALWIIPAERMKANK